MSKIIGPDTHRVGSGNSTMNAMLTKSYVERALKEKLDYPTKEELRKRIAITVTSWDFDAALKALEKDGKILVDEKDGKIIWVAPDDEKKFLENYVTLDE